MSSSFLSRSASLILLSCSALFPTHAQENNRAVVVSEEEIAFATAEQYYNSGLAKEDPYEKGRYMNYVVGLYVDYINAHSRSKNAPTARYHLGYARQTLGRVEEAKNTYLTLIKRHKKGNAVGSAARQLAYLSYVDEDWREAAKYFDIASSNLEQENLRYSALTKKVQCLIKLNLDKEVVQALRDVINTPDHPYQDWARCMLGYQYYEADKYAETIAALEPLLNAEKQGEYYSQALFYTGLASAEIGRDDVANEHLLTILKMPMSHPSLTSEQKKHLSANKAKAQTALMKIHERKEEWSEVTNLYEMGTFEATAKVEGRRSRRAGAAYFAQGDYLRARAALRRVDRALPHTEKAFQASFYCTECDYRTKHPGLPEQAGTFLELYQKQFPKHPYIAFARFYKAEGLYDRRDYEAAAFVYQKIDISKLSTTLKSEILFKLGWSLSETGQFDGATRNFGHFIANHSDDPRLAEVHNKRGEAHFALGDKASALRDFDAAIALQANDEQTAFALQGSGRVLRISKDYEKMIERYRTILSDYGDLPRDTISNANYWIGWGYYKLEQYDDAPAYLRKARDLAPEFYSQPVGDLLILTAFSQLDKEALHIALQEVFQVAPFKSVPPHMLSWLGVQMYHDGEVEIAESYLARATDIEKPKLTEVEVWRILAKAQNQTEKYVEAEKTGLLLLQLDQEPRWKADAYLDFAEAKLGQKKYQDALDAAGQGLDTRASGSHIAGFHLIQGEVALQQERWEDALRSLDLALSMVPDDPSLQPRGLYAASLGAEKLGNLKMAHKYKSKLKRNFPDYKPKLVLEPLPPVPEIVEEDSNPEEESTPKKIDGEVVGTQVD